MNWIKTMLLASFVLFVVSAKSQDYNPYQSIGKKAKVLTLSKGKYVEFFDNDSIQRIGTVLINIKTRKLVKLLKKQEVLKKGSDNSSASRWYSIDPLTDKFREWSPYNFSLNNPLRFKDKDGKAPNDIVTYNSQGQEISRVKSNTEFRTLVQYTYTSTLDPKQSLTVTYEAPMPGVAKGYETSQYQQHDYQIAASTFIFNKDLSAAKNSFVMNKPNLPATANHTIGTDLPAQLDVNVVKAMVLQETRAGNYAGGSGTGQTDIMQSNNKQDWVPDKASAGMTEGQVMTPQTSLNEGIKWLFIKGMGSNDAGVMNWRNGQNGDWWNAVDKYNANPKIDYVGDVKKIYNSMTTAQPSNY